MRLILAIALVACCTASAHAQRAAATAAPVATRKTAPPVERARSVLNDDAGHGNVWIWVVAGAVGGGVIAGSAMDRHCARRPESCVEFSIPLVSVLGVIGGAGAGAVLFHLREQLRSPLVTAPTPASRTPRP